MGKKKNPWSTKVGKDCVDLRSTMCEWIAKRLLFLAKHTNGIPMSYCEKFVIDADALIFDDDKAMAEWKKDLAGAAYWLFRFAAGLDTDEGRAQAKKAMHWVAEHLGDLWD